MASISTLRTKSDKPCVATPSDYSDLVQDPHIRFDRATVIVADYWLKNAKPRGSLAQAILDRIYSAVEGHPQLSRDVRDPLVEQGFLSP